jgi:2-polyprenyl-3-methyl-5-hydroxy-6-metoxy-1,4-benzoquinol methylase
MPLEQDLAEAYASYYTHEDGPAVSNTLAQRIYTQMREGYLSSRYGYRHYGSNRGQALLASFLYLNPPRRKLFDLSVFCLRSKPNGRLLEVGCGNGASLKTMEELGWQVEGLDFDETAVEQARKKGLTVHVGTLEEKDLPGGRFDAIVARHLIEHVPNPSSLLRECRRLLAPGGLLVLITPNARSWGHRLYRVDWRGLEPPRHLHIFSRTSLRAACIQAGFSHVDCRSIVRSNSILLQSRMLRQKDKSDSAQLGLLRHRLWSEGMVFFQWAVSLVDPEAGDELVMVARQ